MIESELYKELGILTKEKDRWEESMPYVSSLLTHESVKIRAKALSGAAAANLRNGQQPCGKDPLPGRRQGNGSKRLTETPGRPGDGRGAGVDGKADFP